MKDGKNIPTFELKRTYTYGETLSPIFDVETEEEAAEYTRRLVEYHKQFPWEEGASTPEEVVALNIGYWAGYGTQDDMALVLKLFKVTHPIFGG